ncbi:MAG TPA: methyl-accepting chemotaxis protein, partial [Steroidobacteraceae bacterium]
AEAVSAVRSSTTQVESGVASARSAGDALASILEGSEAMQQMVTEIAAASAQQSQATQSVNGNVQEITRIIELTTLSSTRAVEACTRLSSLAANLNQLVGAFKVSAAAPIMVPAR